MEEVFSQDENGLGFSLVELHLQKRIVWIFFQKYIELDVLIFYSNCLHCKINECPQVQLKISNWL